jgi:hypothetical protein
MPLEKAAAALDAMGFKDKGTVFENARDVAALLWAAPANRAAKRGEVVVRSKAGELRIVPLGDVKRVDKAYFACPQCGYQEITPVEVRDRLTGRERMKACRNCSLLGVRYPELARFAVGFDPMTVAAHAKRDEQVQFRCSAPGCSNIFYRGLHNQASSYRDKGELPHCREHGGR